MQCTRPVTAQKYICNHAGIPAIRFKNFIGEPNLELRCNKCQSCKLTKAKEWALRLWHESQMHEKSSYVTFTYAPENLPAYENLKHKDFQDFMKRFRRRTGLKIRYFMCGEYGDATHRPHYHAIIYGYFPPDAKYHRTEKNHRYYKSEQLDSYWKKGFTDTSHVSYHNAGYVARYTLKKQLPKEATQDRYTYLDANGDLQTRTFEYVRMSTGRESGDGLGASWFKKYMLQTIEHDYVLDPNGFKNPVPKYYLDYFGDHICPDTFDWLAEQRLEKAQENTTTTDQLRQKAICVAAKSKQLIRPYL